VDSLLAHWLWCCSAARPHPIRLLQ
jgi:hypothetical protein